MLGTLRTFAIDFAGVVTVRIETLEFTSRLGQRPDVRASGVTVELQRELAFLDALTQGLPADGFSDGPSVSITPQGVTAGYSLGVPPVGIGILTIEQLVVSAAVLLPFDDRPAAVRLAFSERANPFVATVSMLGGGGYLAIEVDTAGVRRIEGAVEVGAETAIDLAVVTASVHVMVGFYFGFTQMAGGAAIDFSGYLRIGGCVDLLGVAGVSIELALSMTLDMSPGRPARIGGPRLRRRQRAPAHVHEGPHRERGEVVRHRPPLTPPSTSSSRSRTGRPTGRRSRDPDDRVDRLAQRRDR